MRLTRSVRAGRPVVCMQVALEFAADETFFSPSEKDLDIPGQSGNG